MANTRSLDFIKSMLPTPVVNLLRAYRSLDTKNLFTKIYEEQRWGRSNDPAQKFYSGDGTHNSVAANTYFEAVKTYLQSFAKPPNVVDLGCGDFYTGSKLRPFCGSYVACDIVPALIEYNKDKFKALNVDFRELDIIKDELPDGDVVFIRQVLQHLSNKQIAKVLPKLQAKYKFLVITEHLPGNENFVPNADKLAGTGVRLEHDSGVIVTSPPFNFACREQQVLCEAQAPAYGKSGVIRTFVYSL